MVTRNTRKVKKAPKVFSRRARTGFAAAPTDSFRWFKEYIRLEVDKKDISGSIRAYIKKNLKKDSDVLLSAPEWAYSSAYGAVATIEWLKLEKALPSDWDGVKAIELAISNIREAAIRKLTAKEDSDKKPSTPVKSPMTIVKQRTSEFIAEVEAVIDEWSTLDGPKDFFDVSNYSPYNELKKIDASYNVAKGAFDYYTPILEEAEELVSKKTPDLVEGYSHMSIARRKEYRLLLKTIVDDLEKYMLSKKALRKTRAPKVKSADKQVEKVQYLKESTEYKVVSIPPSQIPGASTVFLFNTKQRLLTKLVTNRTAGFEITGTTIQGWDSEASVTVRLRKPLDFLPVVLTKTPNQINKELSNLTTKPQTTTGRVNKDMVILRVIQ